MASKLRSIGVAFALLLSARGAEGQQVTENCTVSVLNRTVTANADGTWVLPNVPANFGPVRARVTCTVDGQTISGESDPFTIPANGVVNIPQIRFGQTTAIPTSLTVTASPPILGQLGATSQLAVTALYSDGSTKDVTADGTTYTISNAAIATVGGAGTVQAVSSGTVIVQASHEGASGMTTVRVALAGNDRDGDGIPDDVELSLGLNPNNPVDAQEDFDRDGLTNLQEFQIGTDLRKADTDGDGLKDGDEINRYFTSPLLRDTDGDGIGDGLEVETGSDPTNPASFNLPAALNSIAVTPAIFTLTFNTVAGDVFVPLRVTGTLKDGTTIDVTLRGINYASNNLAVCNFGAVPGRVFAGITGSCTVTATLGTFSSAATGSVTTFAPRPLSSVALGGPGNGVDVAGDYVYVAAGSAGLKVVDVTNRSAPHVAATLSLLGNANDVKLSGTRAFVAAGAAGLSVIDISNPLVPRPLGSVDTPGDAIDVRVRGNLAFVADGAAGLQVIDVTNPASPRIVGAVATGPGASGVDVENTLAVVATGSGGAGVRIVDVSNPASPVVVGSVATPGTALDVVVRSGFAYVADHTGSLRAVDFRTPTAPVLRGTIAPNLGGFLLDVALMDTLVFGADVFFVNGVPITDVSDPSNLASRPRIDFPGDATGLGIAVDGSHVYLGTDTNTLYVGQYRIQQDLNGIPPIVSIASPADGATFVEGETIPVTVSASDDLAVAAVALQVNGVTVATDTSAPYQFSVTAPTGATSLFLGATASDLGNNTGAAPDVLVNIIPDPLTVAVGRVVLQNGTPVAGASVTCLGQTGVTLGDGSFAISGVPTAKPAIVCTGASVAGSLTLRGQSAPQSPVRGGETPIGDVVLAPVPVISSITPNVIDSSRPPATIQVTGANFTGSTFFVAPVLNPRPLTIGTPQINAAGTIATLPISVAATARGRFTLVGTNSFGGADTAPTTANSLTVFNAQDDGDADGDGYADGLELLFGSDPQDPTSIPDFTRRGDLMSPAVSVSNTQLPATTEQTTVSAAVSVSNTLLPAATALTAVSAAVSVSNTLLPAAIERTAVSAAVSVSNTLLSPAVGQHAVSAAFSVSNLALGSTQQVAMGSVVSVLNQPPTGLQSQPPQTAQRAGRTTLPLTVRFNQPASGSILTEGATIVVSAAVTGAASLSSVAFTVNGETAFASTGVTAMPFTVPSGVATLTFGVTVRDAAGRQASAAPVTVDVAADPTTTVTGRVVDAAGNPVQGAVVDLLSAGLEAEFFKFSQPLRSLPDLTGRTPDLTTRVTALNLRNPNGVFGEDPFGRRLVPDYAARFTGWIAIPAPGVYTFFLGAHEGARLKLGDATVIDMSAGSGVYQEVSRSVELTAGLVPIEVTYYESAGNAALQLSVAAPGAERQIVAPSWLVPNWRPFVTVTDASGRFTFSKVPTALDSVRVRTVVTADGQDATAVSNSITPPTATGVNLGDIVIRRTPR